MSQQPLIDGDDALSDEDEGVEFDTLMDLDDDLSDESAALPEEVTSVFSDCASAR